MTTFGYIGLGMMGSAMAERLLEHGDVVVFDVDATATATLETAGATVVASAAEVAAAADVISTCVPAATHLRSVLTGPSGLVDASLPVPIVIHSTVAPATIIELAGLAQAWEAPLFDACVAGGADAARKGELAIFCGGHDVAPPVVHELLEAVGSKVFAAGGLGAGAAMKLAVNVMTYAQFGAAAAAYEMFDASDGQPAALLDAWRHVGMLGALTESFAGLLGIPSEQISGSLRHMLETQVGIARKDLELAGDLGGPDGLGRDLITALHDAMARIYNVEDGE